MKKKTQQKHNKNIGARVRRFPPKKKTCSHSVLPPKTDKMFSYVTHDRLSIIRNILEVIAAEAIFETFVFTSRDFDIFAVSPSSNFYVFETESHWDVHWKNDRQAGAILKQLNTIGDVKFGAKEHKNIRTAPLKLVWISAWRSLNCETVIK